MERQSQSKTIVLRLDQIDSLPGPEVFDGVVVTGETQVEEKYSMRLAEWVYSCENWAYSFRMGKGKYEGFGLVDGRFVVSLRDNTWRAVDKRKWYGYISPDNFISRYIVHPKPHWKRR